VGVPLEAEKVKDRGDELVMVVGGESPPVRDVKRSKVCVQGKDESRIEYARRTRERGEVRKGKQEEEEEKVQRTRREGTRNASGHSKLRSSTWTRSLLNGLVSRSLLLSLYPHHTSAHCYTPSYMPSRGPHSSPLTPALLFSTSSFCGSPPLPHNHATAT